jgi:hypothetical protein
MVQMPARKSGGHLHFYLPIIIKYFPHCSEIGKFARDGFSSTGFSLWGLSRLGQKSTG